MAFDINRALAAMQGAKALGPHPALLDSRTPVSTYSPGGGRQDAKLSQRSALRHSDAYGGGQAIDWVYDCINLYADAVSTAPFRLKREDGTPLVRQTTDGTPPDHQEGPADLYRLLDEPNPFMLYDELFALLVTDLLLVGNGYWLKWRVNGEGKPLALYRLAPPYMKIVPGPFGPKGYEYQPPGAKDPLVLSLDDVVHFKRPNPHDHYYGMGVIQGAGRSMDLELAVTDTIASYYENRADPSMIVQAERRVPRDVFNKLRAQLRSRASGTNKAGELLVLENGLKASSLSRSAADSLFNELSKMSQDRVYTKFRASRKLFGMQDTTGQDKVSDVRREFDNSTLSPFMTKLQALVTARLAAAWGVQFEIDYRYSMPPDEAVKVAGEIAKVPGIKVREVRRQYAQFGIDESTGDKEIDELVLNMPTPQMDANGQQIDPLTGEVVSSGGLGADQPLPGEPGRPPKPSNTRPIGVAGAKAFMDDLDLRIARAAARAEGKALSGGDNVRTSIGNRLPGEKRPSDTFATARRVDIDRARDAMVADLRAAVTELERDMLDHVEGKALKTSDLAGRVRKSAAWKRFKDRLEQIVLDHARAAAVSGVLHSGLTPEDDLDYDGIAKSIANRPEGVRRIVSTLRDRMVKRIIEARDANAERGDFEAEVRQVVSDWAANQAVTIADSEATEAYNEGTLSAAEAMGIDSFYVVEEDDAPDEACQDARGQVWDLATSRANRKEHPNCRRAFIPLSGQEAA